MRCLILPNQRSYRDFDALDVLLVGLDNAGMYQTPTDTTSMKRYVSRDARQSHDSGKDEIYEH
jgi:hypothetical protein